MSPQDVVSSTRELPIVPQRDVARLLHFKSKLQTHSQLLNITVGRAFAAAIGLALATMVGSALALTVPPLPRPPPELKLAPTPLAAILEFDEDRQWTERQPLGPLRGGLRRFVLMMMTTMRISSRQPE